MTRMMTWPMIDSEISVQWKCIALTPWQPSVWEPRLMMVCTVEQLFLSLACPPPLRSWAILRQTSVVPVPSILFPEAQGVPECQGLENALTFRLSRSFTTLWSPLGPLHWFGYRACNSVLQALRQSHEPHGETDISTYLKGTKYGDKARNLHFSNLV